MPRIKSFDENEILEKAMFLFWEKGFYATSMQDLVTNLGINRASIYDTYGDKMQLFLKAFAQYRKTSLNSLKTFLYSQNSVKEGFKKLFLSITEESVSDKNKKGCFVVNTTTELTAHHEVITSIIQENQKMFVDLFYDHLKTGVENGEISNKKDLRSLALFLFTLNNDIKVLNRTSGSSKELKEMVLSALTILD
ncbi:TetR/AcrR family transcriptional regulator [Aquimarina gracilis]|uniref:TetR/AcrR family transcriptional regulator n=1 Tax=Aquimarina gracilis TaxID=874422 RepID=A0ABU5ZXV2_9FLAO|nr:TetR/AcrR family transcriptional regulator [Aquimarina gracilis]MEB3346699.1 TetR/AcrR family transcriptional regulator [Aquimarina gracilis]